LGLKELILIILLISASPIKVAYGETSRRLYTSTYILENRGEEPYMLTVDDVTILLFHNDSKQSISVLNLTSSIAREYYDEDGNRLAVLDLPLTIAPRSNLTFSVTYLIETREMPRPRIDPERAGSISEIPRELVEEYTSETGTFTTGDEMTRTIALRLGANQTTVLGIVLSILDWMLENISYGSFETPRYPNETIASGRGDCDDQAILLVTMCRILGIPALLQLGLVFNEGITGEKVSWGGHLTTSQRGVGWHGWALVYIPPWGWLPIDLTLTRAREPLTLISEAPQYGPSIVTALNVSRYDYVGDSRRVREAVMAGSLYIKSYDIATEMAEDLGSSPPALIIASICIIALTVLVLVKRRTHRWLYKGRGSTATNN
jgi:transglutaminase-like putative cysteine protease